MIRFEGVSKRYAAGFAVEDLTLEAPTGQITVLVGPSGCGKTTTLRMVNRMVEPTSGTIWLSGQDTATLDEAQLRRGIGYVIQHAGLFPHRTVVDNVATIPRLLGWDRRRARARAMEVLERVGLDAALAHRYPSQLSGGQQQRVACARALVSRPAIVFADEPTGNLDSRASAEILGFLRRSVDEFGQSVVMVTHEPSAAAYADRVLFLDDGRIVDELREPTADSVLARMRGFDATVRRS